MEHINKTEIRGKVIKLELKIINFKTLAKMTVATEYVYGQNGEAKIEKTFHYVEAWENTQVKDLTKLHVGSWVRVIGRYRTKSYVNANNEEVKYMEIYADYVKKLADNTTECMNKAEITGTVMKIELKIVNNHTVGNLSVVTNYVFFSKGENKIETTYHRIEAWASPKIKDLAKISMGSTVKVVGRYRKKEWENNGKKVCMYEVYADDLKKISD